MYMEEKGYIGVLSIKQDHVNVDDIINCSRSLMLFEPQKFFSSKKKNILDLEKIIFGNKSELILKKNKPLEVV